SRRNRARTAVLTFAFHRAALGSLESTPVSSVVRFCASGRVNPGWVADARTDSLRSREGVAEGRAMSNDLTPAEVRFVNALRGAGPLGTPPTGLARVLGITPAAVGTLSYAIERKGYCTRERYGMR